MRFHLTYERIFLYQSLIGYKGFIIRIIINMIYYSAFSRRVKRVKRDNHLFSGPCNIYNTSSRDHQTLHPLADDPSLLENHKDYIVLCFLRLSPNILWNKKLAWQLLWVKTKLLSDKIISGKGKFYFIHVRVDSSRSQPCV